MFEGSSNNTDGRGGNFLSRLFARRANIHGYGWERGKLSSYFTVDNALAAALPIFVGVYAMFDGSAAQAFEVAAKTATTGLAGIAMAAAGQYFYAGRIWSKMPFDLSRHPIAPRGLDPRAKYNGVLKDQALDYEIFNRNLALPLVIGGIFVTAYQMLYSNQPDWATLYIVAPFMTATARFATAKYMCEQLRKDKYDFTDRGALAPAPIRNNP